MDSPLWNKQRAGPRYNGQGFSSDLFIANASHTVQVVDYTGSLMNSNNQITWHHQEILILLVSGFQLNQQQSHGPWGDQYY